MSQQILVPGIDPTAYPTITGGQLAQLVSAAIFAASVGAVITTTDDASSNPTVPQAQTDTTLKQYLWVRVGNGSQTVGTVTLYMWNPNGASVGTLLQWQSLSQGSISPLSITGSMIAPSTIDKTKISGVLDATQIAGLSPLSQFLLASTIFGTPGAPQTYDQFIKLPANSSVYSLANASTLTSGKLLSHGFSSTTGAVNQNTTAMASDVAASLSTSQQKLFSSIASPAFASVANTIDLKVTIPVYVSTSVSVWFGIYDDIATTWLAYGHRSSSAAASGVDNIHIHYQYAVPAPGIRTYSVYFGSTDATANHVTCCKSGELASLSIEELLPN